MNHPDLEVVNWMLSMSGSGNLGKEPLGEWLHSSEA